MAEVVGRSRAAHHGGQKAEREHAWGQQAFFSFTFRSFWPPAYEMMPPSFKEGLSPSVNLETSSQVHPRGVRAHLPGLAQSDQVDNRDEPSQWTCHVSFSIHPVQSSWKRRRSMFSPKQLNVSGDGWTKNSALTIVQYLPHGAPSRRTGASGER
jgi:hypothetical protein